MTKNTGLRLIVAVVLILALGTHPYSFYQVLRWIVAGVSLYLAYLSNKLGNKIWFWIFIGLMIIFNPISPFYFSKETWHILDIVGAVIFTISVFKLKDRNHA